VSCNHTLIIDVIEGLNQIGTISIKFTLNSKITYEFDFSFEFCQHLVKVFNIKVVPNIPLYLQKKVLYFSKVAKYFLDFLPTYALNRNSFRKFKSSFP
jgi:hypothetical protein